MRNRSSLGSCLDVLAILAVILCPSISRGGESDGVDFFEKKIRPVLVKECYACHSSESKKLKGGLRLDTRAEMLAGGDSGPALVPGKPEESLILEALRYDGVEMPPKGKLSAAVVADFEHWIKDGAQDPRTGRTRSSRGGIDIEAGRKFWAYQPPRHREPPNVVDVAWPRSEIDRFVLAKLEAKGIKPARDASKRDLIRRLSFDLLGLPPTTEEVEAFEKDESSDAVERLVDRWLGSPHFGERWGRHWLDVVRFAESLTLRGFVLKNTWRYRDYVIDAFNADLPYDQFLREQVAGDLLPYEDLEDQRRKQIAPYFLVLGDTNLEEQDKRQLRMDVVDEQLDTIGKAFLAQTIGCARCHDHKFDPIPTRDYYALAGIFRNVKTLEHANVSMILEKPLPASPEAEAELVEQERSEAALEARIKEEKAKPGAVSSLDRRGPILAGDLPGIVVDDLQATRVGTWKASQFSGSYIGDGYLHDMNEGRGEKSLTFHPELPEAGQYEIWLAYSAGDNRASDVPVTILSADGEKIVHLDQRGRPSVHGRFASLGQFRFEKNGQGYVLVSNDVKRGHVVVDAVVFVPVAKLKEASRLAKASKVDELTEELKRLRTWGPKREQILSVKEEAEIADSPIHIRGSVHNLGEVVPRGFLRVASVEGTPAFAKGESGRRELADWLCDRANPLTARVIVNRVWGWLFGEGLVGSTDNFGTTGDLPSHPELLDELAVRFMEDGWSIKTLVRRIVLSRAYQLSTEAEPDAQASAPEPRFLSRRMRRRLDAESIRDAILSVSGQLRSEMKGPGYPRDLAADYGFDKVDARRSVYAPVLRNALPELFATFDFADPGMVVGRRNVSTVAPQALFLLNHPFIVEQSGLSASRLLEQAGMDDEGRLTRAFRLALGRPPTDPERQLARRFLGSEPKVGDWALLFQALFASIDFRYVN
ncbi:DUF1553 domain-containing protein [Singulisphaera sp. PoT]|uniref:DUF1553 domain-containing protein n=1 Tax=Singulisphaera sp. PoT TaxID=3411797 RepID=UPI003BF4B4CD